MTPHWGECPSRARQRSCRAGRSRGVRSGVASAAEHHEGLPVLGVLLAALSAATFAFNNASARRGVLTGSVAQALAITVPIGVPIFFLAALATGALGALAAFSGEALGLLALAGVLHFVVGRYCKFREARAMGAPLA